MARQKEEEFEQEIDVSSTPPKKTTFAGRWFNEHAVNDRRELKMVCDLSARSAWEQFRLGILSENTEILAVVFYGTFLSILDFIKKKQKRYNQFTIQIAQSLNIGYINSQNTENEKVGNFQPIMEYLNTNMVIIPEGEKDDEDEDSDDNKGKNKSKNKSEDEAERLARHCNKWKDSNAKTMADSYSEIENDAFDRLKRDYIISLRTSEAIIPLFCIFLDNIANVLKVKYREAQGTDVSEVSMNVLGLFDVFYSLNEDEQEIIEFQPNIAMKLALKNDDIASGEED